MKFGLCHPTLWVFLWNSSYVVTHEQDITKVYKARGPALGMLALEAYISGRPHRTLKGLLIAEELLMKIWVMHSIG